MESGENPNREAAIGESMTAILDMSEKWSQYIKTREAEVRVAKSFIAGMLVFLFVSAVSVAFLLMLGSPPIVIYPEGPAGPGPVFVTFHHIFLTGVEVGAAAGIASGLGTYYFFGRRENKELKELEGLIGRIKETNKEERGTEGALSIADKILDLLPRLVRRRTSDALLFGIAAFILGSIVGTASVGIVVGALVWIYFRYETNQSYERQLSRLEEQKRAFEKEKKNFLESL